MSQRATSDLAYSLKPNDLKTAYSLGRERNSKGFDGTVDIDPTNAHILGLKGEIAFARLYGLNIDWAINNDGGDRGADFKVSINGEHHSINVKISTYWNDPWLKVRAERVCNGADLYVLGAIDNHGTRVKFVGWATHEQVKSADRTNKTGSRNHIIEPSGLQPMWEKGEVTSPQPGAE